MSTVSEAYCFCVSHMSPSKGVVEDDVEKDAEQDVVVSNCMVAVHVVGKDADHDHDLAGRLNVLVDLVHVLYIYQLLASSGAL